MVKNSYLNIKFKLALVLFAKREGSCLAISHVHNLHLMEKEAFGCTFGGFFSWKAQTGKTSLCLSNLLTLKWCDSP